MLGEVLRAESDWGVAEAVLRAGLTWRTEGWPQASRRAGLGESGEEPRPAGSLLAGAGRGGPGPRLAAPLLQVLRTLHVARRPWLL